MLTYRQWQSFAGNFITSAINHKINLKITYLNFIKLTELIKKD